MTTSYVQEMTALRRRIHQRPEEGWTEFETTALVVTRLRELGFQVFAGRHCLDVTQVMGRNPELVRQAQERARAQGVSPELLEELGGYTGCVAVWNTGRPGPVTAFRADMDCVLVTETDDPAHEANAGHYASRRPGLMHACGHDGHTAALLGVAHWIHDHADELCGTVKLLFQPAEEGTRGAAPMAAGGLVDDVEYLVGGHVGCGCEPGEIGLCTKGFLATTKVDIRFTGAPAHAGSDPEKGRNALLAACSCALLLAGIPRSGQGDTRIAVGRLVAGEGRNVIPAHAVLQAETRGSTREVNEYMYDSLVRIVEGSAASFGVKAEIEKAGEAADLAADPGLTQTVAEVARTVPGVHSVHEAADVSGSEDFTMLVNRVREHGGRSAFFLFGCRQNGHHRSDFAIQDEQSLPTAFGIYTGLLTKLNGRTA